MQTNLELINALEPIMEEEEMKAIIEKIQPLYLGEFLDVIYDHDKVSVSNWADNKDHE